MSRYVLVMVCSKMHHTLLSAVLRLPPFPGYMLINTPDNIVTLSCPKKLQTALWAGSLHHFFLPPPGCISLFWQSATNQKCSGTNSSHDLLETLRNYWSYPFPELHGSTMQFNPLGEESEKEKLIKTTPDYQHMPFAPRTAFTFFPFLLLPLAAIGLYPPMFQQHCTNFP